ncbi:DUF4388 domain-containing protein [bacterium]|nr:DUF4388 domain-containing protein [bacterium]
MVDLKGNLNDVGLPLILRTINLGNMTGTLNLVHGQETGNISFRSGRVVFAESLEHRLKLGQILIGQGRLTEQDLTRILAKQKKTGQKLGQLLQKMNLISADELALCLGFQAEDVVFQLLNWTSGTYSFQEGELPDTTLVNLTEQTSALITEGRDQIEELLKIRQSIPSMNLVIELNPISETSEKERVVDLTIDEWQVLSLVDGHRSVAEICELNPANTFTTCRILHDLLDFNVIKPQEVRLFEQHIDESSQHLLTLTTMLSIYNQAFVSIFAALEADIVSGAIKTYRECLKEAKERFSQLFNSLELGQTGSFNHLQLMQNILAVPLTQQIPMLRNGLNAFLANVVIKLKDLFGKKKYDQIVNKVFQDISQLFLADTELRANVKKNLETVIAHTNQVPSSFKLALKFYSDGHFDLALKHFQNIPPTNPNYKKAQSYLHKIAEREPALRQFVPPLSETQPVEFEDQAEETAPAITEADKTEKGSDRSKVVQNLMSGLKCFSQDNYEEAAHLFDQVLRAEPGNTKAIKFREQTKNRLAQSLETDIGTLEAIPVLNSEISDAKLEKLTLSPHEGYLLSRVNGQYSIKEIIAITGLDTCIALKMFQMFLSEKLVLLKEKRVKAPEPAAASVKTEQQAVRNELELDPGQTIPETAPASLSTSKITSAQGPTQTRTRFIDRTQLAEQHYKKGKKAAEQGDYLRAVEELEAAILNNPNSPLYYNLLAEAREKKRSTESKNFFNSGIQELKQKNFNKAIKSFKQALANDPRNMNCLLTLAEVLSKIPGKKEEAIMYFRKALESQPNNVTLIVKIGRLYNSIGERDLAMKAYRNCLVIDSANEEALRELRRLQLAL